MKRVEVSYRRVESTNNLNIKKVVRIREDKQTRMLEITTTSEEINLNLDAVRRYSVFNEGTE